jgi:CRP/FNR family transcriptional regulator
MTQISRVNELPSATNPAILARSLNSIIRTSNSTAPILGGCKDCRLHDLCLLQGLDAIGLEKLGKVMKPSKSLRKGQHLYRQRDEFESIYVIRSGTVKSYIDNEDGYEVAVSFFFSGETVGLDGLFNNQYTSSVVALEDTSFCEIPFAALNKLIPSQPLLQQHFSDLLSRQIIQEQAMTILRGQNSAADRLVAFLLNISGRYARIRLSSRSFRLPMTRGDIAGCLGLTLETVSRQFSMFNEKGWLKVNGKEVTLTALPGLNAIEQRTS